MIDGFKVQVAAVVSNHDLDSLWQLRDATFPGECRSPKISEVHSTPSARRRDQIQIVQVRADRGSSSSST